MIPVYLENYIRLEDFAEIVGEAEIQLIASLAEELRGKSVLHINSTSFGGGVAEILHDLVPLTSSVGLKSNWNIIEGPIEFFKVTKKIHNALQGMIVDLSTEEKDLYLYQNKINMESEHLDADFIVVHDNQPAAIIEFSPKTRSEWIWRCHIDTSTPNIAVWNFLEPYIGKYDAAIFTSEKYVIPSFSLPKILINPPSINPFCDKNKELPEGLILEILERFGINPEKPIISQVARFDPWKDPLSAIEVYRLVKKEVPGLQLLLVASMAKDDPEGWLYLEKAARQAGTDPNIHLLTDLKGVTDLEVNAFQRASSVALQMSTREGFGLTVSEALWKGVPVVGRNVGGIPLQIINDSNGFLIQTVAEAAEKTLFLLKHPAVNKEMGAKGREHVRKNFLLVHSLKEHLKLFSDLLQKRM
jgi:trehalose synthase